MNQQGPSTSTNKYAPHLSELRTDEEQIERVRELLLDADTWQEFADDCIRFGVTKPLYFLQTFARGSK